VPIGRWVMREALRQTRLWHDRRPGGELTYVAVNVTGQQLEAPGFVDEAAEALAENGLPASTLMIEVTESSLIQDTDKSSARLQALRDLGVRLAIDDFGTGYSALNYLRRFPMDVLKIDRSFISDVAGTSQESALVETMIRMSASLGLQVVAEGVEQEDQCVRLQELHCAYGQGYLFSRPVPASALDALFDAAPVTAVS
jgi:EAL domain-containing protein (putative c-di-GMP-specific phosphodiesterase class I)